MKSKKERVRGKPGFNGYGQWAGTGSGSAQRDDLGVMEVMAWRRGHMFASIGIVGTALWIDKGGGWLPVPDRSSG